MERSPQPPRGGAGDPIVISKIVVVPLTSLAVTNSGLPVGTLCGRNEFQAFGAEIAHRPGCGPSRFGSLARSSSAPDSRRRQARARRRGLDEAGQDGDPSSSKTGCPSASKIGSAVFIDDLHEDGVAFVVEDRQDDRIAVVVEQRNLVRLGKIAVVDVGLERGLADR